MITSASDLAKKEENSLMAGASRTCSNGRSRENKCSCYIPITIIDRVCVKT